MFVLTKNANKFVFPFQKFFPFHVSLFATTTINQSINLLVYSYLYTCMFAK